MIACDLSGIGLKIKMVPLLDMCTNVEQTSHSILPLPTHGQQCWYLVDENCD